MIGDRTHQIHKVFNVHRQATKANAAQSLNKGSKSQLCFTISCFCRIQVLLQRVALTKIGKETQLLQQFNSGDGQRLLHSPSPIQKQPFTIPNTPD